MPPSVPRRGFRRGSMGRDIAATRLAKAGIRAPVLIEADPSGGSAGVVAVDAGMPAVDGFRRMRSGTLAIGGLGLGSTVMNSSAMLGRGDMIAGYRVDDMIGVGGMAIVYRAEQVSLGRRVALKVLSPRLGGDEAFRERFRREGKSAAALHHPNVVTIFDSGEAEGRLFIAMLLVEGSTLAEVMAGAGLSADETVSLLRPIGSALDAAHALGLVHRDVKPQNVLLDEAGHPYLADFGIAKGSAGVGGLTPTGGFVGSLNYAAPEQIRGGAATATTDVYALSAVLYQCLTGQVPFTRDTDASVMYAHLHELPPRLAAGSPQADELSRILARGMAKDPKGRYAHAGELMADAAALLSKMDTAARHTRPAFPIAAPPVDDASHTRPSATPETAQLQATEPRLAPSAGAREPAGTSSSTEATVRRPRNPRSAPPPTHQQHREIEAPRQREGHHRTLALTGAGALLVVAAAVAAALLSLHGGNGRRAPGGVSLDHRAADVASAGGNGAPVARAVGLNVTSPSSGSVINAEDVTVRGTVTPSAASVEVQGQPVPVGNGVFAGNAPLHSGSNTISIIASAPGYTPTSTTITLTAGSSQAPTAGTNAGVATAQAASSGEASPAALEMASPPEGGYSILVPSNWSYHTETAPSGETIGVWGGASSDEKLQITVSSCASCATDGSGPDPRAVGLPSGTVSSFEINKSAVGYQAYTSDDPDPDNGVVAVTSEGSTTTGYAQEDLWLPDSLHSTATRILDSFSLLQATKG